MFSCLYDCVAIFLNDNGYMMTKLSMGGANSRQVGLGCIRKVARRANQ